MSNPYQTPSFDPKQFQDPPAYSAGATYGYGNWVRQVRIFAILNIVQGILETCVGLLASGAGVFFPIMARMDEFKKAAAESDGPPPEQVFWAVGALYLAIGVVVLSCGILRIVAGLRNYQFKGRILGMVSIIVGIAPVFTCYCAPSAIGLLVYGLIIFLDPAVQTAFDLARQGRKPNEILAAFDPYQATYASQPQQPNWPPSPPT